MSPAAGTVVAVLLSLVSAAGYALAAVAQSRLAATSAAADGRGALRALLARGQWWWAVGLNAAGALAHVVALHYGPLTLVQPLGALTLVAALPLGAHLAHRRVTRTEWRGALLTLAGLVGLVAVTGPTAPGEALSLRESLAVAAATALLIATLASGRPTARGASGDGRTGRGLGHATASGIASGVASALTQTLTAALARELPGDEPVWWQTALLAVLISAFATGGLLLSQAAYRGGLAAPLAVVNLANPAAAAVIGVALLGETFRAGAWGWLVAAAASLVAARGVVLLTKGGAKEAGAETGPASPAAASEPTAGAAADLAAGAVTAAGVMTALAPSPLAAQTADPLAALALAPTPAHAPGFATTVVQAADPAGASGPGPAAEPTVVPSPAAASPRPSHLACH
ncbi:MULTISPECIES: DMT family transporter [Streptomyces]|uniref:Membrane protein n=1 Tax=Streptomyces viridochromogenes TaxID=1938 RepID=A0A0L8JPB1_STRVR|nr:MULTISPECIES: DMT family transporter [Streptomyces]KOG15501.1 membrane protein [Streptomyces viridochromogenes]